MSQCGLSYSIKKILEQGPGRQMAPLTSGVADHSGDEFRRFQPMSPAWDCGSNVTEDNLTDVVFERWKDIPDGEIPDVRSLTNSNGGRV